MLTKGNQFLPKPVVTQILTNGNKFLPLPVVNLDANEG